ncbi:MAG: lysylphosphatidylglycerol synthase transmembrane domain-containing protein, partial [Acidimicrobiales bacterium]
WGGARGHGARDRMAAMAEGVATHQAPRSRWAVLRRVLVVAFGLAAVGVAVWVISGKRGEIADAGSELTHLRPGWLAAAVAAELASILAFAALQRRLLHAGGVEVGLVPLTGITFAGNALQNSLPGGAAVASVYAFRQFRRRGASDLLSTWMLIAVSVLSGGALAIVAGVGLAMAEGQAAALGLVGAIVGVLVLTVLAVVVAVRRGALRVVARRAIGISQRLVHRPRGDPRTIVSDIEAQLLAVTPRRHDWLVSLALAILNWLWDASCLAMSFLAIGNAVPWRALLLAYGAAQLAANLPITPGGLGVVEGSLTIALVAYGGGRVGSVAAVLLYRIISFWGLLVVGWIVLGALSWSNSRRAPTAAAT